MPIVSIIVLTKNRPQLLSQALESVEKQTLHDYEVVLVNDGSTDATLHIIEEWRVRIPQLIVLTHTHSLGIIASRQEALVAARGKYIAILDDDDVWTDPDKVSKQIRYLDAHPGVVLVGGGMEVFADNLPQSMIKMRPERDQSIRKVMLFRNNFFTSTVMFKRSAALEAGGFVSDGYDLAEDYDLWLRLGLRGDMYNFPEVFVRYRQSLYTKDKFKAFLRKQLRLIQAHQGKYPYYWLARMLLVARLYFRF